MRGGLKARVRGLGVLVAVAALVGCGGGSGGEQTQADPPTTSATGTRTEVDGDLLDRGRELFDSTGCGSCHRLADAGSAAAIGPGLDEVLAGSSAEEIRDSIVDPGAELTEGFAAGVMPAGYGEELTRDELDDLVAYLVAVAGDG